MKWDLEDRREETCKGIEKSKRWGEKLPDGERKKGWGPIQALRRRQDPPKAFIALSSMIDYVSLGNLDAGLFLFVSFSLLISCL